MAWLKFTAPCILSLYVYCLKWQDEIKFITRPYIIPSCLPRALCSRCAQLNFPPWKYRAGSNMVCVYVFVCSLSMLILRPPCNASVRGGLLAVVRKYFQPGTLKFSLPLWYPGSLKHIAFLGCFPFWIETWSSNSSSRSSSRQRQQPGLL